MLEWIKAASIDPLDEKLVPGASVRERQHLAALGALAAAMLVASSMDLPTGVESWLATDLRPSAEVVDHLRTAITNSPDAALADLYATLVQSKNRRPLGTFFTPSAEVKLMLEMWNTTGVTPGSVVDIGAGVGVFTAAAADRWPKASVVATDVNPVTLGLLAVQMNELGLTGSNTPANHVHLALEDFTTWIETHWQTLKGPRLILGNPPYTRAQLLPIEERARLNRAASGLCGTRSSLSALMTAISLNKLESSDGLCLLLPAQWLESHYATKLRSKIWGLKRRRIELRLVKSGLFDDALVDAVALMVGPETNRGDAPFAVAMWDAKVTKNIDRTAGEASEWRTWFAEDWQIKKVGPINAPRAGMVRLGDIAQVRRGLATGANDFFMPPDTSIADFELSSTLFKPMLRRAGIVKNNLTAYEFKKLDQIRPNLLHVNKALRESTPALDKYLQHGERNELDQRYLCAYRPIWYDLTSEFYTPEVIFGPMTRFSFRIIENSYGAGIANNLYGWDWVQGVTARQRKHVLRWLRSDGGQAAIREASRQQGDGLCKVEPNALKNIYVPI